MMMITRKIMMKILKFLSHFNILQKISDDDKSGKEGGKDNLEKLKFALNKENEKAKKYQKHIEVVEQRGLILNAYIQKKN